MTLHDTNPVAESRSEAVSDDKIEQLLAGAYRDPDSGAAVGVATKSLVIRRSLAGVEGELVEALGFGRRVAVVSDHTTHDILGRRVERALEARHSVQSVVLPEGAYPDDQTVRSVRDSTAGADALIAVGSGMINDLAKYASSLDGKPYAVFATAPSMNGYTSITAAITEAGHKKSLAAQAAAGVFFDLSILAAAPKRLIRAGLGDSICRTTAEADWLLAHLLFDLPFRQLPYDLLRDDEPQLLQQAGELMAGSIEAMEGLVRTLVLSGFGTAIAGSSQPASQGEHLISHFIDMFGAPSRPLVFHGEQVGVTTLSMARLQERMLDAVPVVVADTDTEQTFRARYGEELGGSCWDDFKRKRLDAEKVEALNARIGERWGSVRQRIDAILLPSRRIQAVLEAAGAPVTPQAIHLPRSFYDNALLRSREIRNRYTFLDLAANGGRLAGLVPEL